MTTHLSYSPACATYDFGPGHPMKPARFTLAVELAKAWGLIGSSEHQARLRPPAPASGETLGLFHTRDYLSAVAEADAAPWAADPLFGLGDTDTPAFSGMHAAAAAVTGSTDAAVVAVLSGEARNAFAPAGGMHHAHAGRAAGFCIYNDCAVAIAAATLRHPGLRVAYVDIDAHHGDGVQEAFYTRSDVLTLSVHESGRYLYPGTGAGRDVGEGAGWGYSVNVALPPFAGDAEYGFVTRDVIAPALRAFAPDLIVAQLGGDAHHADPLTHLGLTVAGHVDLTRALVSLADELCDGRLVATGGGGYEPYSVVPRMWASALAVLLGREIPEALPDSWRERVRAESGDRVEAPQRTLADEFVLDREALDRASQLSVAAVEQTRAASPLLGGGA